MIGSRLMLVKVSGATMRALSGCRPSAAMSVSMSLALDIGGDRLDRKFAGSVLKGIGIECSPQGCRVRVYHECHAHDCRRNVLQSLQPLTDHRRLELRKSRDVPARTRIACDITVFNRSRSSDENDGNRFCLTRK